jgi:hypothetical protein
MIRMFAVGAVVVAVWLGSAQPADAQVLNCLTPGELKDDFSFGTQVMNASLIRKARTIGPIHLPAEPLENPNPIFGKALVQFAGPTILLDAFASRQIGLPLDRQIEAFARGRLFVDFAVDCGSTENASVVVAVSFRVRRVGRMTTLWPGSTSTIGVSARIRDVAENRDIDFRVIEDTTVGNLLGNFKTIAKVPVPIPEVEEMSLAKVETFVIQVRKGRVYRFELFAAAKSTTGLTLSPGPIARANFHDPVDLLGRFEDAGIELAEFTMDVALDPPDTGVQEELAELRRMIESLRQAVASLGAQLEAVGPNVDVLLSDLSDKLGEQDERHAQAVEQLRVDVETQTGTVRQALDALTNEFENHTHGYLTGKSEGHNNTAVTTSTPKKKVP